MLQRHREKMGQYYLGGEVPEAKEKKKKKKKGDAEALPEPEPEPELPLYMQQSMAGGKMARPTIKGEDDSSDDEYAPKSKGGGSGKFKSKIDAAELHAGLGTYDPLKPLGRGEEMPSVEAYPTFDPYANEPGGPPTNAFAVGAYRGKDKKKKKDSKKKDHKKKDSKGEKKEANNADKKEKKAPKAEEGKVKKEKKEKSAKTEKKESKSKDKKESKSKSDKAAKKLSKVSIGEA